MGNRRHFPESASDAAAMEKPAAPTFASAPPAFFGRRLTLRHVEPNVQVAELLSVDP
jgi:hypothetical protein